MGFKFKKFTIVGGSEELPVGVGYITVRPKCETLLKKIVQALLDTNTGWVLDSRTPTITSFLEVPDAATTTSYWPGLLLYNSNSGCKLFAAYIGTVTTPYGIKNFSGNDIFTGNSSPSGLCLSMIPSGSTNSFGQSFDSSFLPSDATRIIGTSKNQFNTANQASSGIYYTYGVLATDSVIGISANAGEGATSIIGAKFFVGKIFGKLLHENDNLYTSKYGLFRLMVEGASGGATDAGGSYIGLTSSTSFWSSNNSTAFIGSINNSLVQAGCTGSFTRANGSWILGTDGASYCVKSVPYSIYSLSSLTNSTINGKTQWIPFIFGCLSNDLDTYGVIPGDGMKGYLDTDLFRCAIGTYGQQFDNGNFICIDGDYNFLIGWDPDNDPLVGE